MVEALLGGRQLAREELAFCPVKFEGKGEISGGAPNCRPRLECDAGDQVLSAAEALRRRGFGAVARHRD